MDAKVTFAVAGLACFALTGLAAPLVWRNVRTAVVPGSARLHNRAVKKR